MSDDERMHAQRQVGPTTPDSDAAPHSYRRVTSFRSRRASLTEQQQEVWDRLWPSPARWPARGHRVRRGPAEPLDTAAWFGRRAPVVLEIGCGTGTSTLAMAQAEPDIDVVAVEVYRRGLAQLLSAIDREGVTNIRLVRR